jgi:hypothetical protein
MELYGQIKEHEVAQARTEARTAEIFAFFDEVRLCPVPRHCCTLRFACLSDLREMAGTATGRCADVDAFDGRDTECY